MARNYSFTFSSEAAAITFVSRAMHYCSGLAVYRNEHIVYIIDAEEYPQREELLRLAQTSGARKATWQD